MGKIGVTDTTEVELTTTAVNKYGTLEVKGLSNILFKLKLYDSENSDVTNINGILEKHFLEKNMFISSLLN